MEEVRSSFKILTGKPTRMRPLGKPKQKWEDSIKGISTRNWVNSVQDRDYWRALVN